MIPQPRASVSLGALIFLSCCYAQPAPHAGCELPLSQEDRSRLVDFVRKQYSIPDQIRLAFKTETLVGGTCYRRVIFEGTSAVRTWELPLFASPDRRFLMSDLYDTAIDPADRYRSDNERAMRAISPDHGASLGSEGAPVTIIAFSDFQCPFCRQLSVALREVLSAERDRDRVRFVFHHLPLSSHPWARTAAIGAACGQRQSRAAFWSIHDHLFENQAALTVANINEKLRDFGRAAPLDYGAFQECLDSQISLGVVLQDINLASSYGVTATPTLFINGQMIEGIRDAAHLRELIAGAGKEGKLEKEPKLSEARRAVKE